MSKKNTSTITFRIDEDFDEHLRKIAKERKISLNTLANQIFGNYLDLDVYMEKFGVMMMSKKVFKMFLDKTDVAELKLLALDAGSNEPKEFILFKWKEITSENVSTFMKIYCEHCGYGQCDLEQSENKVSLSVRHNFGKKGSVYLGSFLTAVVTSTLNRECSTIESDESITISFVN
ncbi:MAG: hypothetical protein ABR53_00710 [Nitrosopumilus sp. BACL13 MAG-121220-bin23]|jgi:hypothetical protein|nr:MAG: hypothetical protein ABR53_00710 [Nitrosopumilus sp. BACL13 MAG-121220-bin23]HIH99556.1 hypothetical protein [Nitrosopumilus sp.]